MGNLIPVKLVTLLAASAAWTAMAVEGDPRRGAQEFRQCAACHSLQPGRHLTGPSLAGVMGRPAGRADGFRRYSDALASSGLTWDRATLERWLADPTAVVPQTSMRIRPIADAVRRRDIIAFLAAADASSTGEAGLAGMMPDMVQARMPNLRDAGANQQVKAIRYCGDAYRVTLATGKTYTFWEFNLRFKSDSSPDGPSPGAPAIVGQGMQGDRAQIVFSDPAEISPFIRNECPEE